MISFFLMEIIMDGELLTDQRKSCSAIAFLKKNKLICNIFPEKDAFTVMIRLTNQQFESVYDKVESYTQAYIDQKYACGDGGWIHYRVLSEVHVEDIKKLVKSKCHI